MSTDNKPLYLAMRHDLGTHDLWTLTPEPVTFDEARKLAITASLEVTGKDIFHAVFRLNRAGMTLETVFYPVCPGMSHLQETRAFKRVDKFLSREKPYTGILEMMYSQPAH